LPDGIQLNWNNKLRNTAGRASWKTYVDVAILFGSFRALEV
jgi:hypothetical protein